MKKTSFTSKCIILLFLFVVCNSCAVNYKVDTILVTSDGSRLSNQVEKKTIDLLYDRFVGEEKYKKVTIVPTVSGLVISLITDDTTITNIEELHYFFGSADLGVYEAGDVTKPGMDSWVESIGLPNGPGSAGSSNWRNNRNLVLEVEYDEGLMYLKDSLSLLLPDTASYILAWQYPENMKGLNRKPSVHSLYLYHRSQKTGGASISNHDVLSTKISMNYNLNGLVAEIILSKEATAILTEITTSAFNDKANCLGILIDGEVLSNPRVQGIITSGRLQINGSTDELTKAFARQVAWEPLPVHLISSKSRIVKLK